MNKKITKKATGILMAAIAMSSLILTTACTGDSDNSSSSSAPVSSNNYGIHVSANTELARKAANTLIDKAAWCGFVNYEYSYGYVLTNGRYSESDGMQTYSNYTVSANEDPMYPYTGTIVLTATRHSESTNCDYPLTVTVDWEATDYGDYYSFTWTNTHING